MNLITRFFRRYRTVHSCSGAVVFLDKDILTKEDIEKIKQRMTPVFVEYSGQEMRFKRLDVAQSVRKVGHA